MFRSILSLAALLTVSAAGAADAGIISGTPVPEPAALGVLAAGAGAIAILKFRRRR